MEIIEEFKQQKHGVGDRLFAIGYALLSYMIGASALFWLIFAAGGFAPLGFVDITYGNGVLALVVNAMLVVLFGVQHSIMARKWFKHWLVSYIPRHLERSTFVLVSGLLTLVVIALWQNIDAAVWVVESTLPGVALQVGYWFGIAYLMSSSFVTNHFELFGLRQAWLYFSNRQYTPLEFKQRWMYRYSRHPMMLGFLFIFWCSPEMSVTRFTLALLFTIYIFEGIRHEEGGLIEEFGDKYREYRKEIGLFFTLKKN
jgi:protein-S-isoprenylcysteine O-methyltransferase Ste14